MDANDSPLIQKLCEEEDVSQSRDGISSLPDDILLDILSFLTTKESIRTSILSKRWRNLWISVPTFHFDVKEFDISSTLKASLINLVRKALLLRDDLCIQKFHLRTNVPISKFHISKWIAAAIRHNVRKLDLSLYIERKFLLPPDLFASQSLREFKLQLFFGTLLLPRTTGFFSLKTLFLTFVEFPGDKSTEQLFCGCPVLEEIVLENCCWDKLNNVTLVIPSLRKFTICNSIFFTDDDLLDCKIKICAVNLISFHWASYMIVELLLENLPSLVYAYVDAMIDFEASPDEPRSKRVQKLLSGIQNVKSLSLSSETLEFLLFAETPQDQVPLPSFDNLTHIKLEGDFSSTNVCRSEPLMHFLQKSPNLKSLDLSKGIELEENWVLEIIPHCVKFQLKTFSLLLFDWEEAEINLLKYLFEKAAVLERVKLFRFDGSSDVDAKKQEIIHQLNILRNSSGLTKCVIEFL